ncbi:sulfotransferase family protein [Leptolyngbya sp. 7M]|uniref:sulfotransferase family protein n=1 Tax=Leptolyngbya sp. 7M TaxID=2812896 RepID=UPI001B8D43B7|nr:sulfotransferase [Leptolyngbya sp. 7M]QYO67174.1 sulfotransferase [Leptolyngbya sp. 7M]
MFLHKLDTQFALFATPLGFDDQEHPEIRFHDQQPVARRKNSVKFFKACLQRQILYTGKSQIIAKPNYSIHRIKTLMEEFPDAKFVYLVRSPYETIPSHLSLHRNIFDNQWGIETIPTAKLMRYYQRRYCYNVDLYRYFYQCQKDQDIPADRIMVVRYDSLHSDLYGTFENIVAFTGLSCSRKLQNAVLEQSKLQGSYRRTHAVMDIEQFGLTKQQIANDLDFVFAAYGLKIEPEELVSNIN